MKQKVVKIALTILFIGLAAQLSYDIPVGDGVVPISGQTFAIFLAAWFLKPLESVAALLLYLLLGGLGLPIFADGSAGWRHLTGSTAGFLWMFVIGAWLVSYLQQKYLPQSFIKIFSIQIGATLLVLSIGAAILALKTNNFLYFSEASVPFIPGGIIKCLIATQIILFIQKRKKLIPESLEN